MQTNVNNGLCSNDDIQVAKASGNNSTHVFKKRPEGEYKATVSSGQAIGCQITGDTQEFPSKSIVYEQKKTVHGPHYGTKVQVLLLLAEWWCAVSAQAAVNNVRESAVSVWTTKHEKSNTHTQARTCTISVVSNMLFAAPGARTQIRVKTNMTTVNEPAVIN